MGAAICRGEIRDGRGIWGAGGAIWTKQGNSSGELSGRSQEELPPHLLLSILLVQVSAITGLLKPAKNIALTLGYRLGSIEPAVQFNRKEGKHRPGDDSFICPQKSLDSV